MGWLEDHNGPSGACGGTAKREHNSSVSQGWETPQGKLVQALRREHAAGARVLAAIERVPRDVFVSEELRHRAYEDTALPIGLDQTISQPTVVAVMLEALALTPESRVLEVGTGSGYQAAVLAELVRAVVTVERLPALAERAGRVLDYLGYLNVEVRVGDGTHGWPAGAPYDAIVVSAAGPVVPPALLEQLGRGGRLVIPIGGRKDQQLILIVRTPEGALQERSLGPVQFVPLVGALGW